MNFVKIQQRVGKWFKERRWWVRRHVLLPVSLLLLFVFAFNLQQYVLAQESDTVYLPLVESGDSSALPSPTRQFQANISSELNSVVIGLEQDGNQQFLVLGGESNYAGAPLYTYLKDDEESGESACNQTCAEAWPPFTIEETAVAAVHPQLVDGLGTTQRADGTIQVTYDGWPLYRYAGDVDQTITASSSTSTANGHGIDGLWWRAEVAQSIADDTVLDDADQLLISQALFESSSSVISNFAEAGSIVANQPNRATWHTVTLDRSYQQPVVIMQPLSFNGGHPSTIRVRNVTDRSFQFKIDEWPYLDGAHLTETIHYMVVEAGVHTIPNSGGRKLHAGLANVNHEWSTVSFEESFRIRPVVLSQVQTFNDGETIVTRQRSIGANEFQVRLQEEEAGDNIHEVETVGYIALNTGRTKLGGQSIGIALTAYQVTHNRHQLTFNGEYESPIFLAAMQTTRSDDTATLRYTALTDSGATVFVQEEQSADAEMAHTSEKIGYIVLGHSDGSTSPTDPPTPIPPDPGAGHQFFITDASRVDHAHEKSGLRAEIEIQRTGGSSAVTLFFDRLGHDDPTKSSAVPTDYVIRDDAGQVISNGRIPFRVGQMRRTISIEAVADNQIEVPETLVIKLRAGNGYSVRAGESDVTIELRDDKPGVTAESRVFFGQMEPENSATTTASGWAVIRLSNDNSYGEVSMSFSGLTGVQTAAHVHYANPLSGPIVHSIPLGRVEDDRWEIHAMHGATTDQAMLESLLNGRLYANVHSENYLDGEIRATVQLTEGSPDFVPPGAPEPIEPLTDEALRRDILRFLTQASFGPTVESVDDMVGRVERHNGDRMKAYEEWIDSQMVLQSPSMVEFLHANMQSYFSETNGRIRALSRVAERQYLPGWYTSAVYAKAQLRERVALALSEIFVISNIDSQIRGLPWYSAGYDDLLSRNAFGPYSTLLREVSKSPAMGQYLSNLKNQKATFDQDGVLISSPDENYAREIMQLFSIGLVEKHPDGSLKLGSNGLPIRTYDQTDIIELARIFTGYSYGVKMVADGTVPGTVPNNDFTYDPQRFVITTGAFYRSPLFQPMRVFEEYHDRTPKEWLGHAFPANRSGSQELSEVVDVLSTHPNTAVLISRQLIQRLVTSNPSSGYLYRVSQTFTNSNGDIGAVVKAILLDPEARNLSTSTATISHGKIKEPLLQKVGLMRFAQLKPDTADTFNFARLATFGLPQGQIRAYEEDADILYVDRCSAACERTFDQAPFFAPTVFNYFLPDYAPTGPIIDAGLVAPELQLLDENDAVGVYNSFGLLVLGTLGGQGTSHEVPNPDNPNLPRRQISWLRYEQHQWMENEYLAIMDSNGNGEIEQTDTSFNDPDAIRAASAALVDMADDYLCSARLKANTNEPATNPREIIITGVNDALSSFDRQSSARAMQAMDERIRETLFLVASAPQCMFTQ